MKSELWLEQPSSASPRLDKRLVSRSFSRAACRYDGFARLQALTGEKLLTLLAHQSAPYTVLDAGAGTGAFSGRLGGMFPQARIIALDMAEGMASYIRHRFTAEEVQLVLCADCERLPLANGSVDIVFSNLALQWCTELAAVFAGFRRILRPHGVIVFSTFGPATLKELRLAWQAVDQYTHVNHFADERTIRTALQEAGLQAARLETCVSEVGYPSVYHLMRELKGLGAHNVTADRARHLTGKNALRQMISAYEQLMHDGKIRAGFETISGWACRSTG